MTDTPQVATTTGFVAGAQREAFLLPHRAGGHAATYLCGNSLGPQPKATQAIVSEELASWAERGVEGHMQGPRPWVSYGEDLHDSLGKIVGALPAEVALTSTLTANLHQLLATFYRPQGKRRKILVEHGAFPSDHYVASSQITWHGRDPADDLVVAAAPEGDASLTDCLVAALEREGEQIALVLAPGVQFASGDVVDLQRLCERAHAHGALVCADLAHAVGNTELRLHDWQVDCAAWCSYKYLNAGPGAIGGLFVHERHLDTERPRLAGWWSNRLESRFAMSPELDRRPDADAWALSNVPVLSLAPLYASLPIFGTVAMGDLADEGRRLQKVLRQALRDELGAKVSFLTSQEDHGAQLSLALADVAAEKLERTLAERGVICDSRPPNILRVATAPLYNHEGDIETFVRELKRALARG